MALSGVAGQEEIDERYLPCISPQMQLLAASMARVAATDVPVLIAGETGSGKSTLARQLHEDSPRRAAPLVVVQAATASLETIEGVAQQPECTVVIEEVGELAGAAQDSLVHALAGRPPRAVARLISTTSGDLSALVARRRLRADLLYRLDVVRLHIPPLRQRRLDIIFLAEHFLAIAARRFRRDVRALEPDARALLVEQCWNGNVRELNNCMTESVLRSAHVCLRAADLRLPAAPNGIALETELTDMLRRLHAARPIDFHARVQRLILQWALEVCNGNRIRTAALLGIGRGSLRAKLRRYGLQQLPVAASVPESG